MYILDTSMVFSSLLKQLLKHWENEEMLLFYDLLNIIVKLGRSDLKA